jgi:hypothetical protein
MTEMVLAIDRCSIDTLFFYQTDKRSKRREKINICGRE